MLDFHPKPGALLLCRYWRDSVEPEMVKTRPVIVVSPRLRRRDGLCTVVPLSTTPPQSPQDYHCEIDLSRPLPSPWNAVSHWVKADMIATVGHGRLELIGIGRDQYGKRKHLNLVIPNDDLTRIRACILRGLSFDS